MGWYATRLWQCITGVAVRGVLQRVHNVEKGYHGFNYGIFGLVERVLVRSEGGKWEGEGEMDR